MLHSIVLARIGHAILLAMEIVKHVSPIYTLIENDSAYVYTLVTASGWKTHD